MNGSVMLEGETTSRPDIERLARKLATLLADAGVTDGGTVAILMRNDIAYLVAIEACRLAGARYVPLNWHAAPPEITAIVADAGAIVLIGHADLVEPVRAGLPGGCVPISFAAPPAVRAAYPEAGGGGDRSLADLVEPFDESSVPPPPFRGIFAYTSGSTGRPKGVRRKPGPAGTDMVATFRGLAANLLRLGPGDRLHVAAPLYHSAPNGLALSAFYAEAADLHLAVRFDPVGWLADIERHRITHAYLVPTMMVRLLKLPAETRESHDLSSLRVAFSTGSACPPDVKAAMTAWLGPILTESYGASEMGFMTLISAEEAARKPGSVGRVIPGAESLILDESLQEVPAGTVGTIYVRVPSMGDFDYSNAEGALSDQRHRGFTTVGDMGHVDEDGFLFISDRRKDMIITGGANVFPSEIETALLQMPEVLDCAVFGAPDPEFGEMIVAAVECRPDARIGLEEVRRFLADRIARFKIPRKVDVHERLPREDSGKIFKAVLRRPYQQAG